jgi:hypothetical protein
MAIRELVIIGPDSESMSEDDINFLGNLMAKFLYHEIDSASNMLHKLRDIDLDNLEKAGWNLSQLCPIIKGD